MPYQFLVDTYETESIKVVSVWSEFRDEDLEVRPRAAIREAGACTSRWCTSVSARTRGFATCWASTWRLRLYPERKHVWHS